jgi:hypothetical protein
MVNVWTFDSVWMWDVIIYDSDIESNFQIFAICLILITQCAVKSLIIANPWQWKWTIPDR